MMKLTTKIDFASDEFENNKRIHLEALAEVEKAAALAAKGGGQKSRDRHLSRGKLLPRERVANLLEVVFLELVLEVLIAGLLDKMFVEVYPNFYEKLNALSTLSQTDLRLASYIKMNHNNNEIANISGISLRTVESQRYRLSKKLNLEKDQGLDSFLHGL